MYGSETWVDRGYLQYDMGVADMNVLCMRHQSLRKQRENHIWNDDIREMLYVEAVAEAASKNRVRWFEHVQRMNEARLHKKILTAELPGKNNRAGPRRRYLDSVRMTS